MERRLGILMDTLGLETLRRMQKVSFYNDWLVKKVEKYLSGDILEIGAGIGNITALLKNYGNVTATDYEKFYISRLKKRIRKTVNVGFGDIEKNKFFFQNKKFDVVVNFNVLEHIENDQEAINNMASKLNKKGKVIIITPAHMQFFGSIDQGLGHYRRYNKNNICDKFKKAGLSIVEVKYLNWFGGLGWFINSRVLRRKILPSKQLGVFALLSRPFLFLERFVSPPFGLSVLIVGEKS